MTETSQPDVQRLPAEEVARRAADAMWAGDRASQGLGMQLDEIRPRYARLSMRVREDMVNGHAICHGGLIFCLADSAFAFACNWSNRTTVASGGAIDFVAPAKLGERLVATAEERSRAGRTGVYDARVETEDGRLIALFRGRSYTLASQIVPGLEVDGG